MKYLIVFYIFAAFMDWAAYAGGKRNFQVGHLGCTEADFMVVETEKGAAYMLYYSILSYLYAFAMWFIFFQVPKNYGMLKKFQKIDKTDIDALSLRSSMIGAEDNVKTMFSDGPRDVSRREVPQDDEAQEPDNQQLHPDVDDGSQRLEQGK